MVQEYFVFIDISVNINNVNHYFPLETLLLSCHVIVVPEFLNICN